MPIDKEKYIKGIEESKKETPAKKAADKLIAKTEKRLARLRKLGKRIHKFKRTVKEAIGGSKTYLPKKTKEKEVTEPKESISGSQRHALESNISEEELKRVGGK